MYSSTYNSRSFSVAFPHCDTTNTSMSKEILYLFSFERILWPWKCPQEMKPLALNHNHKILFFSDRLNVGTSTAEILSAIRTCHFNTRTADPCLSCHRFEIRNTELSTDQPPVFTNSLQKTKYSKIGSKTIILLTKSLQWTCGALSQHKVSAKNCVSFTLQRAKCCDEPFK